MTARDKIFKNLLKHPGISIAGTKKRQDLAARGNAGNPSFCSPILPFISNSVAAWQRSGIAERDFESIRT